MRTADIIRKRGRRVLVRVPSARQREMGARMVRGVVKALVPQESVIWVEVEVDGKGLHRFRPQDIV